MNRFLILLFFIPLISFGQTEQVEKYLKLHEHYTGLHQYDSVFLNCQEFLKSDRKLAKENHMDYYLILAAFKLKNYDIALKESRKFIPRVYVKVRTRKSFEQNMKYQRLCFELADYYHQTENDRKEYHNLSLINRKFNRLFCGNGRYGWQKNLYNRMIESSEKLGKTHRVKRIRKQLEELEP